MMLFQPPLSAEYGRRLLSLIGIRAAVPVVPILGEGIADLLFRSASINGYPNVGSLIGRKTTTRFSHYSFASSWHDSLAGVGDILGTPNGDADLTKLFYPSRVDLHTHSVNFFGALIPTKQLIGHRRVAPTSLVASAHSKAVWHLYAFSFDIHTGETLLDACPRCHQTLNFAYSKGVCFCHHCNFDLREVPQPIVNVDDFDALRFVTGLVDPERPEGKLAVRSLHPDINTENPGYIFYLCVLSALVLDGNALSETGKRRDLGRARVTPQNLAKSGRAVLNWPSGMFDMMTMLEVQGGFPLRPRFRKSQFYTLCRSSLAISSSLQNSLLKISTFVPDGGNLVGTADRTTAGEQIGTRAFLMSRYSPGFKAVCRERALPTIVLYNCVIHNHKHTSTTVEGRANLLPETIPWFDLEKVPQRRGRALAISLQRFVKIVYSGQGDPWPEVFLGLRSGELPVVKTAPCGSWQDALLVEDFTRAACFLERVQGVTESADFPLVWREACFYLACHPHRAGKALMKLFPTSTLTLGKLLEFSRSFITTQDVSDLTILLGKRQGRQAVLNKAAANNITRHPQAHSYWCRDEIDTLFGKLDLTGQALNRFSSYL